MLPTNPTSRVRLSRRSWLGAAAGVGALSLLSGKMAFASEPRKQLPYRIGCSGRSLHKLLPTRDKEGEISVEQFIEKARQWGCDCVELQDVGLRSYEADYLLSLKRAAFLQSIELSGVSVYTNFVRTKEEDRQKAIERAAEWIERTALLGAPLMVVFPGSNKSMKKEQGVELVAKALTTLAPTAANHGVMLAIENHGMLIDRAQQIAQVVEQVASPWVGANLDTGNFARDAYENIERLVPYAVNCHLKMDTREGRKRHPADLPRKFQMLRDAGYTGRVVLQYELKGDAMAEVPKCLAEMQALSAPTTAAS